MIAIWSPSLTGAGDAERALKASKALIARAQNLVLGGRPVGLHVGLHTGPVVLGLVGPTHHSDFATIGQTVRLAARLCALVGEGQILATQTTVDKAGTADAEVMQVVEGYGPTQMAYLIT